MCPLCLGEEGKQPQNRSIHKLLDFSVYLYNMVLWFSQAYLLNEELKIQFKHCFSPYEYNSWKGVNGCINMLLNSILLDKNLLCVEVRDLNGKNPMTLINSHHVGKIYTYLHIVIGSDNSEYHVTWFMFFVKFLYL